MPPTFLLVVAIIFAAFLAPVVLAVALVALSIPRRRHLGVRMLRSGAIGAAACVAVGGVLNLVFNDVSALEGLLVAAGFGFTTAGAGLPLWRWARAPLPELRPPAA